MKWWLPWRSCDPLSSASREAASRSGCESLGEGKTGLILWRRSSWSRCVKALRAVLIPVSLCLYTVELLNPLLERDQKGFHREEVPPGSGILERPDRKADGEGMDRKGELQKGVHMHRESRGQGRNACVNVGLRQVHSELRRRSSFRRVGIGAVC